MLAVSGAIAGTFGMLWHGAYTSVAGARFPYGIILGIALVFSIVFYAGKAAWDRHPPSAVLGAVAAWTGAVLVNFVAYFFATNDRFFLPAPMGHDPFASFPILLDRAWQVTLFIILPAATWLLLRVLRTKKD